MAEIKIQAIVAHLRQEISRALEDALLREFPDRTVDRNSLFRNFERAVSLRCRTWERVPDNSIKG